MALASRIAGGGPDSPGRSVRAVPPRRSAAPARAAATSSLTTTHAPERSFGRGRRASRVAAPGKVSTTALSAGLRSSIRASVGLEQLGRVDIADGDRRGLRAQAQVEGAHAGSGARERSGLRSGSSSPRSSEIRARTIPGQNIWWAAPRRELDLVGLDPERGEAGGDEILVRGGLPSFARATLHRPWSESTIYWPGSCKVGAGAASPARKAESGPQPWREARVCSLRSVEGAAERPRRWVPRRGGARARLRARWPCRGRPVRPPTRRPAASSSSARPRRRRPRPVPARSSTTSRSSPAGSRDTSPASRRSPAASPALRGALRRQDRRLVDHLWPSPRARTGNDDERVGFFDEFLGKPSQARIGILRPVEGSNPPQYTLVRQSPLERSTTSAAP